jgi:hypothetical protein
MSENLFASLDPAEEQELAELRAMTWDKRLIAFYNCMGVIAIMCRTMGEPPKDLQLKFAQHCVTHVLSLIEKEEHEEARERIKEETIKFAEELNEGVEKVKEIINPPKTDNNA